MRHLRFIFKFSFETTVKHGMYSVRAYFLNNTDISLGIVHKTKLTLCLDLV